MSLLEVRQLSVRFGGLLAVNQLDFQIQRGAIISVIGPNGAGKTTVFNAITGIHPPTAGQLRFAGHDLRRSLNWRTALGLLAVGLLTTLGLVLLVGLEDLWEAVITSHYQYLQPFPWDAAARSFADFFATNPAARDVVPGLIGFIVGLAGAAAVWQRSRRAPEVAAQAGIARTFQNIRLFKQMTALENVLIGMDQRLHTNLFQAATRLPPFHREQRQAIQEATEILRFVGLAEEAESTAENLAYGHQRRLEIARGLAMRPQLLLLDEPAAGLNPAETAGLMDLIRKIRDRGITVLLIEHHMKVVMGISDHIVVLDHGEKIAEGRPQAVAEHPRVIEAYLGKSEGELNALLQLDQVHAGHGATEVLHGIDLVVNEGEIVTVLGANGAGKTTTLMTISGVHPCRQGRILFGGEPIQNRPPHEIVARGISQSPEGRRIFAGLTVRENLDLGGYQRRDHAALAADYHRVFTLFPVLRDRQRQLGGTLSGGEQQMLAISRALMARPRLLLLDEPSLGLAPKLVAQIFDIIRAINQQGMTILLVEQNANMALHVAQRGYVLETGRIVLADAAAKLMHNENVKKSYLGG